MPRPRIGGTGPPFHLYRGAVKSLARPTSRFILFDGENISFDASLVIYIYIQSVPGGMCQFQQTEVTFHLFFLSVVSTECRAM